MRRFVLPSFSFILFFIFYRAFLFHLVSSRGPMRRFCFSSFPFIFYLSTFILPFSCAQPTDSTNNGTVERERIEVSGSISEDVVWESGKEYYVTVVAGATLTIQPDVLVSFTHERAEDYYGITLEGTLVVDGGDSTAKFDWLQRVVI